MGPVGWKPRQRRDLRCKEDMKRPAISAGRRESIYKCGLIGEGATAVDGPTNVAVGSVERFQCCTAGKFRPLEAELA